MYIASGFSLFRNCSANIGQDGRQMKGPRLSFIVHKMMKAFIFMLFPLFVQVTLISDKYGLFLQRSK
ncbi:hypothetical protein Peur_055086 [Populus x canadensis]